VNPPHWTFEQTGEHTRAQLAILSGGGKLPDRGRREFSGPAEAERWAFESREKPPPCST
jgi:hypothetical protein